MVFQSPWILFFLPIVILLHYFWRKNDFSSSIRFSSADLLKGFKPGFKLKLAKRFYWLRIAALLLLVISLARPRVPLDAAKIETEGIDIVLALDCSTSMLAEDFTKGSSRQNRLAVVKDVVQEFIRERKSDRIGMVAFAARAYTVCPLTTDYDWLVKNLERVEIGSIEDGTAIGSAIGSSLNRVRDTRAKSKIIILLTDGVNNTGKISPLTAAEAAQALGIKIYTIGAGTTGLAPYPLRGFFGQTVYQNVKVEIDEATLQKIAEMTGGRYFRATDTASLRQIYQEINKLEKTRIENTGFQEYRELFAGFLIPAMLLVILEIVLANTILRKLP